MANNSWDLLYNMYGDRAIKEAREFLTVHARTVCSGQLSGECPVSKIKRELLDLALSSGAKYSDVPIDQLEQVALLLDIVMFHYGKVSSFNFVTMPVFGKIELEHITALHRHIYRRHVMANTVHNISLPDALEKRCKREQEFLTLIEPELTPGLMYCRFGSTNFGARISEYFEENGFICYHDITLYLTDNNGEILSDLDIPRAGIIKYRHFFGGSDKLVDELLRIGEMARNNFAQ